MKKNYNLYIGLILVILLLIVTAVSIFYTPYDTEEMSVKSRFQPPSVSHYMGTDNFGRDIFSRVMKGSQTAIYVGTLSVGISFVIGVTIGSISGYFGGIIDEILMRLIDAMMCMPSILLALIMIALFGASTENTVLALGIRSIPTFARITRSGFLKYKDSTFITAIRSIGGGNLRIMFIHIFPNILSPLIIALSMGVANGILAETSLSYLGLGVQPPDPSWGMMLKESQNYITRAPWYTFAPGIMVTISVLGFNMLGDGIRNITDSKY